MQNWQIALLTLTALFIGILVPVLLQLYSTLAVIRNELRALGKRLGPILDDVGVGARRVRRIADGVEGQEAQLGELFRSVSDMASSLDRLRSTTQVAAAVGAAAAAGVRAFRETRSLEKLESETVNKSRPQSDSPIQGDSRPMA